MEQKWVAKVILKDLKLGFSHESVLKRFHPDAMELYNCSSMLRQVLDVIRAQSLGDGKPSLDSSLGFSSLPTETVLFSKFKPMLAQRLPLNQLATLMTDKPYCVETKYDGERIIAHVDRDAKRVELYTRNAVDYTSQYAPTMRGIFLHGVLGRQAVLDGEMLAWDELEEVFMPFGHNRTVAQNTDQHRHLCYVVFDMLFYMDNDGETYDLRRTKLQARRELLTQVVEPLPHRLEVGAMFVTSSAAEVQNRLEGACEAREEGLVLKDPNSKYYFNARKRGWFKLKPEYDGLTETQDLLVVGAFFSDSQKR